MTGTSGTHDENGCRLNIHIEHSLVSSTTVVSPDGAGWMAARGANLGCGLSPEKKSAVQVVRRWAK